MSNPNEISINSPQKKQQRLCGLSVEKVNYPNYHLKLYFDTLKEYFGINENNIADFENSRNQNISPEILYAFLCHLTTISDIVTVMVSPHYTKLLYERDEGFLQDDLPNIQEFYTGDIKTFEILIVPIWFPDRFSLGIYEKNGKVQYYDTTGNRIDAKIRAKLHFVIQQITGCIHKPRVYEAPQYSYNRAATLENTGIHCCTIARRYLYNNGETAIENFDMEKEKHKITYHLRNGLNGEMIKEEKSNQNISKDAIKKKMKRLFETDKEKTLRIYGN